MCTFVSYCSPLCAELAKWLVSVAQMTAENASRRYWRRHAAGLLNGMPPVLRYEEWEGYDAEERFGVFLRKKKGQKGNASTVRILPSTLLCASRTLSGL